MCIGRAIEVNRVVFELVSSNCIFYCEDSLLKSGINLSWQGQRLQARDCHQSATSSH